MIIDILYPIYLSDLSSQVHPKLYQDDELGTPVG